MLLKYGDWLRLVFGTGASFATWNETSVRDHVQTMTYSMNTVYVHLFAFRNKSDTASGRSCCYAAKCVQRIESQTIKFMKPTQPPKPGDLVKFMKYFLLQHYISNIF